MIDPDQIETIASNAIQSMFGTDTLQTIAHAAVESYEADMATQGRSATHLYRMCAQFYQADGGLEIATLTVGLDPARRTDTYAWRVLTGTREEIEAQVREHQELNQAGNN